MKYLFPTAIAALFLFQPSPVAPAQVVNSTPSPAIVNKVLKNIEAQQQEIISDKKDTLSTVTSAVLSGELKPKIITRWRTKIKVVHDTVYLPEPADTSGYEYF